MSPSAAVTSIGLPVRRRRVARTQRAGSLGVPGEGRLRPSPITTAAGPPAVTGSALLLFLQPGVLGDDLAVNLTLVDEPFRRVGEELPDLVGVQRFGDTAAPQPRVGDPQLRSRDLTREWTVATQVGQPCGRVRAQGVELRTRDRGVLKVFRRGGQQDAELLGCRGRLEGLTHPKSVCHTDSSSMRGR